MLGAQKNSGDAGFALAHGPVTAAEQTSKLRNALCAPSLCVIVRDSRTTPFVIHTHISPTIN